MRICLLSGEFPPKQGGVGDFTHELGQALSALHQEISVLTSATPAGPPACDGYRIFRTIADWGWSMWKAVDNFLQTEKSDVLNIQYQAAAYGMKPAVNLLPSRLRLQRASRPVVVTTFHDLRVPFLFRGAGPARWYMVEVLARGSDGVIVTNEEDDLTLARRLPSIRRRFIPIGSNIAPRLPANYDRLAWRTKWGIAPHQLALSYFGFLHETKGGEDLIEALRLLVQAGRDAMLLMIGGKTGSSDPTTRAYLARVERQIRLAGLERRVIWTDYLPQEEVAAAFRATDICILPYRDGVSTRRGTLMAALANGMPLVTTQPAISSPYFRGGENMLLTAPNCPPALAEAIQRLADDEPLRQRLSAGALALSRRFEWPNIAIETLAFFDELLHARSAQ